MGRIFPHPADVRQIAAGSVNRLREFPLRLIHQNDARCLRERGLRLLDRNRPGEFDRHRFAVGDPDRHADARRADADRRIAHDFLGLVDDFVLFLGVAVFVERPVEREHVSGELAAVGGRSGDRMTGRPGPRLVFKVVQPLGPFA